MQSQRILLVFFAVRYAVDTAGSCSPAAVPIVAASGRSPPMWARNSSPHLAVRQLEDGPGRPRVRSTAFAKLVREPVPKSGHFVHLDDWAQGLSSAVIATVVGVRLYVLGPMSSLKPFAT